MRYAVALILAMLAAPPLALPAAAQDVRVPDSALEMQLSFSPVVKSAVPSVVNIYAQRVVETSPFQFDPLFSQLSGGLRGRPRIQNSLGSGVIVGDGRTVVSAYHVVGDATDIRVVLPDRRKYDARILLSDAETDLAVLRLQDAPELPALEFADSDALEVGDLVLAIGNPFGVGQTVSSGIVSALARTTAIGGREGYFIQTDAPINPGNSGGALVDMAGRLVGINTAILSRSGGSNGIGFAIPANLVRQSVAQALAGRSGLLRPWAGLTVQDIDGPLAEALGLPVPQGVLVSSLHPESAFARASVQVGDVIVSIGGKRVDGAPEMLFRLLALGVGAKTTVGVLRDAGTVERASVTLIAPPDSPPRDVVTVRARSILNGLTVSNVNPAVAVELDLPPEVTGVVVVAADGVSVRSGLRPGDLLRRINGFAIETTADVAEISRRAANGYDIALERGGQRAVIRLLNR